MKVGTYQVLKYGDSNLRAGDVGVNKIFEVFVRLEVVSKSKININGSYYAPFPNGILFGNCYKQTQIHSLQKVNISK